MCGIVGLINPNDNEQELEHKIAGMSELLMHRGPDNYGSYIDAMTGIGLGHRRLAIQDLSAMGNQPMFSSSGRYSIVFNGEIYNFKEIMGELRSENITFRSTSDTEVLLTAIECWGLEKAIVACEGMFAFAIWDKQDQNLHLCRDRIGEKPLYFGWHQGTFAFASELKSLHHVFPGKRQDICLHALSLYFRYGYVPAPYSINTGIFKLPAGSKLSVAPDVHLLNPGTWDELATLGIIIDNYWSVNDISLRQKNSVIESREAAIDEMDALLRETIKRQLIADVPVGAYLSGGIDSTLVTAIAQQESSQSLKSFTIGFRDKTFNEAPYAKKIAHALATDHHEKYIESSDILDLVDATPGIFCEPHANPALLPTILVSRIARQHVKVCLSGDGGDELFGGYNRYFRAKDIHAKLNHMPRKARNLLYTLLDKVPLGAIDNIHRKLLENGKLSKTEQSLGLKLQKVANLLNLDDLDAVYSYLVSTGIDTSRLFANYPPHPMRYLPEGFEMLEFEERAMLADQNAYLPDDNLAKVDRASMSCGLETRLPLLSHRIIEFSWRVPLEFKIHQKQSKWLLRELLARHVDRDLFERPKMGFSVPVSSWLRNELRSWMHALLSQESLNAHGLFNSNYIDQLKEEHLSGKRDHGNKLWTLLSFQAWYHHGQ